MFLYLSLSLFVRVFFCTLELFFDGFCFPIFLIFFFFCWLRFCFSLSCQQSQELLRGNLNIESKGLSYNGISLFLEGSVRSVMLLGWEWT